MDYFLIINQVDFAAKLTRILYIPVSYEVQTWKKLGPTSLVRIIHVVQTNFNVYPLQDGPINQEKVPGDFVGPNGMQLHSNSPLSMTTAALCCGSQA